MQAARLVRKRELNPSSSPERGDDKRQEMGRETEVAAVLVSLNSETSQNLQIPRGRKVLIGRSRRCDYVLAPLDCSSVQCVMGVGSNLTSDGTEDVICVEDRSTNGTFVNGELVGRDNVSVVRDGDRLTFAESCSYVLKYSQRAGHSFYDKYIMGDTVLGTGHYAEVREGTRRDGLAVAVKIFHPTNRSVDHTQFNRELDILTSIEHPNVVGFYDTFLEPVGPNTVTTYLVLEKVNGGELFNRVVTKGKLTQPETQDIMHQLLTGLSYLHSLGVVHRDLKPENILLEIEPGLQQYPWGEGEHSVKVKIADFGLAKFIGNVSFTNTLCGTPAYVAPEVLVNQTERRYNKAVDMWSVGVLLYVCLCGFPPFSEELGPPIMRQQILSARYIFYTPYWDNIAPEAIELICKLLVADPNKRLTVDQALQHVWLRRPGDSEPDSQDSLMFHMSLSPAISRSASTCEPITLQQRFRNGWDDEYIARTFCTFQNTDGHPTA